MQITRNVKKGSRWKKWWAGSRVRCKVICGALRDLVPVMQFWKREKHPWRSVTFKPATLTKITLLHGCLSRFLNCINGTKSRNAPHYASCMHAQILSNGFWVVSRLLQIQSTINTLWVQRMIDLTIFVTGVSPPVITQHGRLLFLKRRSTLKTITKTRCIRSDILVENCRNVMVLNDPFRQFYIRFWS